MTQKLGTYEYYPNVPESIIHQITACDVSDEIAAYKGSIDAQIRVAASNIGLGVVEIYQLNPLLNAELSARVHNSGMTFWVLGQAHIDDRVAHKV